MKEFDPLGVELVKIERAWHPLAISMGEEYGVVDIDVSPDFDNPNDFNEIGQVENALNELDSSAASSDGAKDIEFIRQKIRAHLMHIRVLSGENINLDEHISATMGTKLEMVDEDILDRHRAELDRQLREAPTVSGLRYGVSYKDDIKNELLIPDRDRLREELERSNAWSTDFILRRTGIVPVHIEPEIVEEDFPWAGFLGTEEKEFFYKTNIHPRHEYTLGRIWANSPHERTHITQFGGLYKESIMRGDMSVSAGVTSLHTPENTQAEFNAQAVDQMALRELGSSGKKDAWQYRFEADYQYYSDMVWNNAHIMVNSGVDEEEVVRYVEERLLLDTRENVAGNVSVRRDDPVFRGYFGGAYWPSLAVGMEMIKPGHMTDPEADQPEPEDLQPAQKAVFNLTMRKPMGLDEIKDKITELV